MTIPTGQSGFSLAGFGALATPGQQLQEGFFFTPYYPCELCLAHRWPLLGDILPGGFAHRIGSGFGDVAFVEPIFQSPEGYGVNVGSPYYIGINLAQ